MADMLNLALGNIATPMVLFFALGFGAALLKSDLSIPEAIAKTLALYLMLAIGFKGGVALAKQQDIATAAAAVALGVGISFLLPLLAYTLLRIGTRTGQADAAAIAAHYGSISVVTFVTATAVLRDLGMVSGGYMIAVVAAMETPAILTGLWLARRGGAREGSMSGPAQKSDLIREIALNGSIVMLLGAMVVGVITGEKGMADIAPFIEAPFKGVLCLFLLDMGLVAARRLRSATGMDWRLVAFGIYMPLLGGAVGLVSGALLGFSGGDLALFGVLAASASYIAVPAAMRLALPEANPGLYVTLSLAVTFPFNVALGIPLYIAIADLLD